MKQKKDNRKNNGGYPGTGRKELPKGEKKIGVTIYEAPKLIESLGGSKEVKLIMKEALKNKLK